MTTFGVMLAHHPPREQLALVRRVEELGFDSVWTGDHLSFHNPLYESLTLLASYAGITSRIRLGVGVYLLALRSPAVAASMSSGDSDTSSMRGVEMVGTDGTADEPTGSAAQSWTVTETRCTALFA